MKKSTLLFPLAILIIFLILFSSVFLPRINIEITIQPQYQSVAKAEKKDKTENIDTNKPHCIVLNYDGYKDGKMTKTINEYYDKGYSLKNFSVVPSFTNLSSVSASVMGYTYFAPMCKE